jgi:hypothetical protein
MIRNLISVINKGGSRGPCFCGELGGGGIERGLAAAANYCDPSPLGEQIAPPTAAVQTGCSNGRCRSLEGGQERVDVDVGQFPGLVGLVRRADGAVRVGGIQIKDQILHVRWRPRCRCLPQAAVPQDLFDDLARMNATTFIGPPHCGQDNGSTS